jgi:hypothetical protein
MTRTATTRFEGTGGDFVRRSLAIVMLFALFLQGFVLNTHIHGTPLLHGVSQAFSAQEAATADSRAPVEDQDTCPICHQIAHSGQYVTPAASALYAPALSVSVIEIVLAVPIVVSTPSFFWQGRAPPR